MPTHSGIKFKLLLGYEPRVLGRQQRDALVDAFEASGVSAMAFAREHGDQTFVSWVRKRRESLQGELAAGQPAFAEVMLDSCCG